MNNQVAILLLSCPDRIGLVSRISHFVFERGGNILDLDEHVDTSEKYFFVRIAWDMKNFSISESEMMEAFTPLAKEFKAKWRINFSGKNLRAAVFVSKFDHSQQEKKELALLKENQIDVIVLARYMQILSDHFVDEYPNRIINIHHSFLPAFGGNNPYRQAYDRGVKIIGATSHYVTKELDDGPIIEQDIIRITHKDTVNDLIRKGRDLERLILARALYYHSQHRVLIHGRKTIIFD